ncbi:MAG: aminotransferase class V-fold PLP-dependent enzyme [Candidatus Thermoplasmatota archaeon]|nr:aminotransferase class V-fold PLP-dependent enzyme [Candidatus Thermoplasmatota archaeon]
MALFLRQYDKCKHSWSLHQGCERINRNSNDWTNLSYANVATTSPTAHLIACEWAASLARGGAAEFDAEAEKDGMMPLRESAANLLGCSISDICVGSSATELLCSLAWAIAPKKGSNIVSTRASFPSTVYPWQRVSDEFGSEIRLAPYDENYYTNPDDILSLIDGNTAVVALSHVEYACGQRYDLTNFSKVAHDAGALLVIDATQSMGMVPIDAPKSGADAIVSSGYKWLRGTYGTAVGYISTTIQSLYPGLLGFRSHRDIWDMKADRLEFPDDASRFEFTTIHFGAVLGLATSIEEISNIGIQKVWEHDIELANMLIDGALEIGLGIASPTNDDERSAIVSLRIPAGFDTGDVVNRLQDEYGILVTNRSGLLRVSPHIDNTPEQIDFFLTSLKEILNI